jgi:cytochrome c biogenesis protein CcmG/thiol:disulfide interchange protein DsbE
MATAYEVLGISPGASRAELEAAYAAKRAAYDPAQAAELGEEFAQLAARRRAEFALAYRQLRLALAEPARLAPAAERRRDRETVVALLVLVVLALLVPLLRGIAVPQRTVTSSEADTAALNAKPAPDFTLEAVDGSRVSLSDFKGQVVLLNLWATWCPPCVRETPRLVRVYEKYREQGFVILGINTTYQDDRAKVEQFVRDHGVSYPVLLDVKSEFGEKYGSRLLPTSYLVDRSGKVVMTKVGEVEEAQLEEQIEALLKTENSAP